MIDVAKQKRIEINYKMLSKKLGVTVIPIAASKGIGVDELEELLTGGDFFKGNTDNDYQSLIKMNEKETYALIEEILKDCIKLPEKKIVTKTEHIYI